METIQWIESKIHIHRLFHALYNSLVNFNAFFHQQLLRSVWKHDSHVNFILKNSWMSFKTAKFSVVQCDFWQILTDDFTTKNRPTETFLRKRDLRDVRRFYQDFLLMIWPKATVEDRTRMMRWAELREVRVAGRWEWRWGWEQWKAGRPGNIF